MKPITYVVCCISWSYFTIDLGAEETRSQSGKRLPHPVNGGYIILDTSVIRALQNARLPPE